MLLKCQVLKKTRQKPSQVYYKIITLPPISFLFETSKWKIHPGWREDCKILKLVQFLLNIGNHWLCMIYGIYNVYTWLLVNKFKDQSLQYILWSDFHFFRRYGFCAFIIVVKLYIDFLSKKKRLNFFLVGNPRKYLLF